LNAHVCAWLWVAACCGIAHAAESPGIATPPAVIHGLVTGVESGLRSPGLRAAIDPSAYAAIRQPSVLRLAQVPLALDRVVDLEMSAFEVFAPDAQIVAGSPNGDTPLPRPEITLLRGGVAGAARSSAFLAITPQGMQGWVNVDDELYVIAPDAARGDNHVTIAAFADLPPADPWECLQDSLPEIPAPPSASEGSGLRTGDCWGVNVAVETDYEYLLLFGGNSIAATNYVATLFGAINTLYERDLDTTLLVSYLRIWPMPQDPWTQTDIRQLLYEFEDYWDSNMTTTPRDTAHMLSGRGVGAGIAYLYALCGYASPYGLSAGLRGAFPTPLGPSTGNWDLIVVSHELGHNFGSPHTHCYNPPIDTCYSGECYTGPVSLPPDGTGTLMSYCHTLPGGLLNMDLSFHSRVQAQIANFMAALQSNFVCDLTSPCGAGACHAADVNCDGAVNAGDLLSVRAPGTWNLPPGSAGSPRADVNGDGIINAGDLLSIRAPGTWNTTTGACICP
jgi:hypothetical protein